MNGAEIFLGIVFLIPLYGVLIWSYVYPEDSHLFGRRWMYEEDPELVEEAVYLHKKVVLGLLILITFMLLLSIYRSLF